HLCACDALHQSRCTVISGAPVSAPIPAVVVIVNAPGQALGEKTQRVGDAKHHHLSVLVGNESIIKVGCRNRDIGAEAYRVVMIYPGIVARLGAGVFESLEARARILVISKSFGAVIAGRVRPVERILAFTAIETDQRSV